MRILCSSSMYGRYADLVISGGDLGSPDCKIRFHGSQRACHFGDDPGKMEYCHKPECGICGILRRSFEVNHASKYHRGSLRHSTRSHVPTQDHPACLAPVSTQQPHHQVSSPFQPANISSAFLTTSPEADCYARNIKIRSTNHAVLICAVVSQRPQYLAFAQYSGPDPGYDSVSLPNTIQQNRALTRCTPRSRPSPGGKEGR